MNASTEQYMKDSQGRLVPKELVKEIDLVRDELVMEIVGKAKELNAAIRQFKDQAFADIGAFIDLSAERYEVKVGGKKGNVQLTSYDGRYKVVRSIQERITFDERLQIAKELVDECIHRWADGARSEIRALVEHAFQVDSEGRLSTSRVLGLRRLDIQDEQWLRAMQAITDSLQVIDSKAYVRVYERVGDRDHWRAIALDAAGA